MLRIKSYLTSSGLLGLYHKLALKPSSQRKATSQSPRGGLLASSSAEQDSVSLARSCGSWHSQEAGGKDSSGGSGRAGSPVCSGWLGAVVVTKQQ